jgi:hypothetical protein
LHYPHYKNLYYQGKFFSCYYSALSSHAVTFGCSAAHFIFATMCRNGQGAHPYLVGNVEVRSVGMLSHSIILFFLCWKPSHSHSILQLVCPSPKLFRGKLKSVPTRELAPQYDVPVHDVPAEL